MSVTPFKELDLYAQIADAIGGTLEEVYNMQERERMDLITVLGLEGVDYNANYQVSPSKYRTRTVVKMERKAERGVNESAALEDGEASIVEEKLEKDLNGNIITSDRDTNKSDENSETKESDINTGDKDSSPNLRKTVLVVKQSSSSKSPDMISDLSPTPDTSRKSSWRSKLSLKRKGRKSTVPKTESKDMIPETSFDSPDQFAPVDDVTQQPPSAYAQPVPRFLIQKLSSPSSVNTDMSGSSSQPSLPSNLLGKMLSVHPLPVQDVLARHDLPLHQGQQVAGGGGDWRKYRGVLDNAFEKISKFKSQGLFHAGTEGGLIWADQNMKKWGKKSVKVGKERQELRRSTRKKKKSFSISDSVFVSGDWALSSEEEVGRETPIEEIMSKKTEDEDELPVKGEGEGESEEKKRRGGKRKLFSKNNDYMDDSAVSGNEEESFNEDERKKKYPGARKGLRRTMESLKKEGSLSDLCGD